MNSKHPETISIFIARRADIELLKAEFKMDMRAGDIVFSSQWFQDSADFEWERSILPRLIMLEKALNDKVEELAGVGQ